MFLVLSFDIDNTSSVNLHCMTKNIELANQIYTVYEDDQEDQVLLELIEVNEEFTGSYCFYWGKDVPGITILRSTNKVIL